MQPAENILSLKILSGKNAGDIPASYSGIPLKTFTRESCVCVITCTASLGTKTSKWIMTHMKTLAYVCSVYLCVYSIYVGTYVLGCVEHMRTCVHVYM